MPALSTCAAVIADGALAAAAGLPSGAAGLALLVGGLLALAGDEDAGQRAAAQHVLALGLGALASAGLATVLAALVAPLTARL